MKRLSLKKKMVLTGILPLFLFSLMLITLLLYSTNQTITEHLSEQSEVTLKQLASESREYILLGNTTSLKKLTQETANQKYIRQVTIKNTKGEIISDSRNKYYGVEEKNSLFISSQKTHSVREIKSLTVDVFDSELAIPYMDDTLSTEESGRTLGTVALTMRLEPFIELHANKLIWIISIIIISVGFFSALFYFWAASLIKPIVNLTERANKIHKGQISEAVVDFINSKDNEYWVLEKAFNDMALSLTENQIRMEIKIKEALNKQSNAMQARNEFLTNISHDLRTPIHSIQVITDHLAELTETTKTQAEYLSILNSSTELLNGVINSVLDAATMENNQLLLNINEFDIFQQLQKINCALLAKTLSESVQFHISISPKTPRYLTGDSIRITQVLMNLLGNSFKFTENGYVSLSIEPISIKDNICNMRFEVKDTGEGISEDDIEQMFQRYYTKKGKHRNDSGTGLGLSISHEIIKTMNGHIFIESALGEGTTFYIDIPLTISEQNVSEKYPIPSINKIYLLGYPENVFRQSIHRHSIPVININNYKTILKKAGTSDSIGLDGSVIIINETKMEPGDIKYILERLTYLETPIIVKFNTLDKIAKSMWEQKLLDVMTDEEIDLKLLKSACLIYYLFRGEDRYRSQTQLKTTTISKQHKILLADDNRVNTKIMEQILTDAGQRVTVANNGNQALQLALTEQFDLLILDQQMPGLYGTEIVTKIKEINPEYPAKFILLSADVNLKTNKEIDVDLILSKPISKEEILKNINYL